MERQLCNYSSKHTLGVGYSSSWAYNIGKRIGPVFIYEYIVTPHTLCLGQGLVLHGLTHVDP